MRTFWGVAPPVAALLGFLALSWAFIIGIGAALDGSGSGAFPYEIVFIIAALVLVVAFTVAIVNLVRGRFRVLAVITIVITMLPIIALVLLRVAAF